MRFPEVCYKLTDMDLSGVLAEFVALYGTATGAVANITVFNYYVVPKGKLLVLQNLVLVVTPGAAQTARYAHTGFDYLGIARILIGFSVDPAIAAAIPVYESLPAAGIIIPEGMALHATANFNAGVAANMITVHGQGWLIPRGSVAI
jgi:hypothetical protein